MHCIVHADLDAFYASVEQRDNPQLRGKPVVVGGRPEWRGVVAACSYEARTFGIHSAMPMRTALKRCPSAILVTPRFDCYHQVSVEVMDIFRSVTSLVEPISLDEAFLDITNAMAKGSPPIGVARYIKQRVKNDVGLAISVGIASCKSVAKIASDLSKPDGLIMVEPGTEAEFLAPLPVRMLWGIGLRTEERLVKNGLETLGTLALQPDDWLEREFGKRGPEMKRWSLGQDTRAVKTTRVAKSVGAELTFPQDINEPKALKSELLILSAKVAQRMMVAGIRGRTVTLKLRLSDFTTLTRNTTLTGSVQQVTEVNEIAQRMLMRELYQRCGFRLVGVSVSNFVSTYQLSLFDWQNNDSA